MKIDKTKQKECISKIKEFALNGGYKKIQNTVYKVKDENIIYVDFLIVNSEFLVYRTNIKKMSFDDIFWKIMRMEENSKKGNSLRVSGAFVAPAILVSKGRIELAENIGIIAESFIKKINDDVLSFLENLDMMQYILSEDEIMDSKILQCLVYIELNLLSKAKELAKKQIEIGDTGRFENEGKGFFELVLLYNQ